MTLEQLAEVWTPLSVAVALISGLAVGLVLVGRFAADPAYASGRATALEYGLVTAMVTIASGLIFYGGQILTSWVGGDTAWTRVASRFGLWVVYSVAIGIGTWVRLRRHMARKRVEVHERAVSEIEADA